MIKRIEYNVDRTPLIVPEYGRNVQLLIEHMVEHIHDREERNKAAYTVVNMMAQQNPQLRNQPEFLQKLWDFLYIVSDGKLDVDYPFPLPDLTELKKPKLEHIGYSTNNLKYHFYGKNIELMIEKAISMQDEEQKPRYIQAIVNYMRYCYRTWNDDKVSDDIIIKHLTELSEGQIILDKLPEAPRIQERTHTNNYRRFKGKNYPNKRQNHSY